MGWDAHVTSFIMTITDSNSTNLNLFDNYGNMSESEINMHATTYVDTDTSQM